MDVEILHREVHASLAALGGTTGAIAQAIDDAGVRGLRHHPAYNPICCLMRRLHSIDCTLSPCGNQLEVSGWDGQLVCVVPLPEPVKMFVALFDNKECPGLERSKKGSRVVHIHRDKVKGGLVLVDAADGRRAWASVSSVIVAYHRATAEDGDRVIKLDNLETVYQCE